MPSAVCEEGSSERSSAARHAAEEPADRPSGSGASQPEHTFSPGPRYSVCGANI